MRTYICQRSRSPQSAVNFTRTRRGFTLLELLAVIAILAILAAFAYPDFDNYLRRAREAVCMANLKSITTATHAYLADHGAIWPQTSAKYNSPEWANFWIQTLEAYGASSNTWKCPQIAAQIGPFAQHEGDAPRIHYTPTGFPPTRGVAYRWTTQPWFIEAANAHGKGCLIAFPDGAVKPLFKVLAENGSR